MNASIWSILGIDPEDFNWKKLSLCADMDTELFFDDYESDINVANMIDEAYLSCPVMKECQTYGVENKEWGVWGGVFLVSGNQDTKKNSHKTKETWRRIRERIG